MTSSFRGGGRGENEMLSDVGIWERGGGGLVASVLDIQLLYFLFKKIRFPSCTHHAESNSNILLTRNLPIVSSVRQ